MLSQGKVTVASVCKCTARGVAAGVATEAIGVATEAKVLAGIATEAKLASTTVGVAEIHEDPYFVY